MKSPPSEEPLSLEEVEMLVHQRLKERLVNIRTAFRALDPDRRGSVSCQEFIHIMEDLLSLSQSQINTLLNKVKREQENQSSNLESGTYFFMNTIRV